MKKRAILFYVTLFLLILTYSLTTNKFDNDLWARLIAGMGVIDGGHVLTQDFLSYTPVHTWWDHEWGAGVVFYAFLKFFGPFSLIILQAFMLFGILFTASKVIKIKNPEPYNILIYFFVLMSVMQNLNNPIRCHMFSFLFFTIFIYILEKVRQGKSKLLFIIPPFILLWNNIHGGVVAGLGLLGMYALGEFLNKKPFKNYLITFGISALAMFINPWGCDYIKFLLMANTMKRPEIVEWWGLFAKYNMFRYLIYKIFILVIGIVEFLQVKKSSWEKLDKTKYIVLLVTLYLGISHVKLLPFFAISALCYCYDDFYKVIPVWKDKLICIILLCVSIFTLTVKDFSIPVGIDMYPVKEVEFIKQNNLTGKILVDFNYGSFVSYKLYPHNLIFMDGRYEEVYYDYMVPLLKEFSLANKNWRQLLLYFPPDVMILENKYPIYDVLKSEKEWALVYEGKSFGVFVPEKQSHKKFKKPTDDLNYYKKTLFDTDIKF